MNQTNLQSCPKEKIQSKSEGRQQNLQEQSEHQIATKKTISSVHKVTKTPAVLKGPWANNLKFQEKHQLALDLYKKYPYYSFDGIIEYVMDIDNIHKNEEEKMKRLKQWLIDEPQAPDNDFLSPRNVWLIIGETGQGKSTFTNHVCGKVVAKEGKGIHSETLYSMIYKENGNLLIDTPGLFDTRVDQKNSNIMEDILTKVKEELKHQARIDGILLMWNPVKVERFRVQEILDEVKNTFGESALDSIVLLVNKITKRWFEEHDENVRELAEYLESNDLNFPIVIYDCKQEDREQISRIEEAVFRVEPYNEDEFEYHRLGVYYEKFLEVEKQQEEVQNVVDSEVEKVKEEQEQREEEHKLEKNILRANAIKILEENQQIYQEKLETIQESNKKKVENLIKISEDAYKIIEKQQSQIQSLTNALSYQSNSIAYSNSNSYVSISQPVYYSTPHYYAPGPLKKDGTPDMRYKANKILYGRR